MKRDMYKGFKKTQEDEKSATMTHENGHQLKIAKAGLSPAHKKELAKLPLYQADPEEPIQDPNADSNQDSSQASPDSGKAVNITINSAPQGAPQQAPPQSFVDKFAPPPTQQPLAPHGVPIEQHSAPALPASPADIGMAPSESASQGMPAPASVGSPVPMATPTAPAMPAPQQPQLSNQLADLNAQFQQNVKHQQDADTEFQTEMAKQGGIDPRRVFANMSVPRKISTAIGLILGGIGGGITGQENPALKMLNKEIDNDVMAQKEDKSNKFNLFKMHMQSLGDQNAAILQTQNNLKQAAIVKMDEALGTIGNNPMAQQRIVAAKTQLQNDIANNQLQLAQHHTMQQLYKNLGSQGASGDVDPASLVRLVPEGQQKDVAKEIGDAQNLAKNRDSILAAYDKTKDQNTILGRAGRLGFEPPALKDFKALVDPYFKDNEGRYNETEANHIYSLAHSPGTLESSDKQNRQALVDWLDRKSSAPLAKANGIDLSKYKSTSGPKDVPVARKTADGRTALFDSKTKKFLRYQ